MKIKKNKKIYAVFSILLVLLLLSAPFTAYAAADTPSLDLDEQGSISVTLYSDENEEAVTGGALSIYEIADIYFDDGNMAYEFTDEFLSSGISLDDIEDTSLPGTISEYIKANDIDPLETDDVDDKGSLTFTDLALGLYLVVQSEESDGYYDIEPFLVTVPEAGTDGWIYNVDATPKTEVIPEITPEGSKSTPSSEGNTPNGSQSNNSKTNTNQTNTSGNNDSRNQSKLPKTGQLNWPIPALAILGIAFLISGYVLVRKSTKNEN